MNTNTASKALFRASHTLRHQFQIAGRFAQLQQPRTLHTIGLRAPFPALRATKSNIVPSIRLHSTEASPPVEHPSRPLTDRPTPSPSPTSENSPEATAIAARRAEQPSYQLSFTCKVCSERSTHHVTKQAYHHGTTLISCPGCKNRHLISDHLKIFSDTGVTLEDIMREKGKEGLLRKGRVGESGDVEFYSEDGGEGRGGEGEGVVVGRLAGGKSSG